jgi:drug/metabolite transporter (DMT)-like permease
MKKALIRLHFAVFLAGFTGILGRLISLNEGLIVTWRIGITVISLFLLLLIRGTLKIPAPRTIFRLMCIGTLIALHWVLFFGSIKVANVSIGLVCFAAVSLFTALLEPLLLKQKLNMTNLLLGLMSLAGISLIFGFDPRYRLGIGMGLLSSLLASAFSVLNKKNIDAAPVTSLMLFELSGGLLILLLLMPLYLHYFPSSQWYPDAKDFFWLLVLSWLCTVLGMDLMMQALHKVSAFTQNLTLSLEPVYGIIMAFLLFHENKDFGWHFYAGVLLIAGSVVLQMIRVARK